jgi:hypothetical protein
MFDHYTERARRSIFFARYEASTFRSLAIRSEHLLLGILREDKTVLLHLGIPHGAVEEMRKEITPGPTAIATSVDLPLSPDSKQALFYAADEAKALSEGNIDSQHLMLGLLRVKNCTAVTLLQKYGVEYAAFRQTVASNWTKAPALHERPIERASAWEFPLPVPPAAPSLEPAIARLQVSVQGIIQHLAAYSDSDGDQPLKRKPWTRKEAFGHLIDCATAHQQWVARILTEPKLVALTSPQEDWVAAQHYRDFSWQDTVDLWVSLNRLIVHVLAQIPEAKLVAACQIGIQPPIALSELIARYVDHCEDIVGQILGHL